MSEDAKAPEAKEPAAPPGPAAGSPPSTPPADPESPASAAGPHANDDAEPQEAGARPTRLESIVLHDWPLKSLALVLAVLAWYLVREDLRTKATVTARVEVVDVPGDVALVGTTEWKVDVTISGTRAEVDRARAKLDQKGEIKARMPTPPATEDEGTADLYLKDFAFPFDRADLVSDVSPPVRLSWQRVAQRTVAVEPPSVLVAAGSVYEPAPGWPSLDAEKVRVRGPKRIVDSLASIPADPVDPTAWLRTNPDLATLWSWSSGFDSWRGTDPLKARRVLSIDPDPVRGKVKFRPVGAPREVEHALRLLLPDGGADALKSYDVVLDAGPAYDVERRRIRLTLKGEKRALDDMEANPGQWTYVVEVPPPPAPGEPSVDGVSVPVRLLVGPSNGTGRAVGQGVTLEGSPTIRLTLRKKST